LIDERLAFQDFVASDIPLKDIGLDGSVALTRPDIATLYDKLFDTTFAFSDDALPFTSLTLVEFKKPERSSYNEKENPVAQAIRYIREIREKKAFTRDNRVFRLQPNSPIHVHVIYHIVDNLLDELQGYNYCQSTDGEGIWLYMDNLNAIVEIISFEKLIADAKKRNEVFFSETRRRWHGGGRSTTA
jgi:hypothetical protein